MSQVVEASATAERSDVATGPERSVHRVRGLLMGVVLSLAAAGCGSGGGGGGGSASFTVPLPVSIATASLPDATVGASYAATITASGGSGPLLWSVASGSLPPGVSLDPSGTPSTALAGNPTAAGTYVFTIAVAEPGGTSASRSFTIEVLDALAITSPSLRPALQGGAYSEPVTASGGSGAYAWDIATGALPAGMSLSSTGTPSATLAGTPTAAGAFNVTIRVRDGTGVAVTRAFTFAVNPALQIVTTTMPDGAEKFPYTATVDATGGSGTGYKWTRESGLLPNGITFATTGTPSTNVFGTPTTAGTSTVTVRVSDSAGYTASRSLTFVVNPELKFVTPAPGSSAFALPMAIQTVPYSFSFAATGGEGTGYAWTVSAGNLPPGLMLPASGTPGVTLSGTPTQGGSFAFTVRVTDPNGVQVTRDGTLQVSPTASIASPAAGALAPAVIGTAYGVTLRGQDGSGAGYAWSISGGTLPPGLALGADGTPATQISGIPTAKGTFGFTVKITDGSGTSGTRTYSMVVADPAFSIATKVLPPATVSQTYGAQLVSRGAAGPVTWSVSNGSLPAGLTLTSGASVATVDGTPGQVGVQFFTIQATDGTSTASWPFRLEVKGPHRWVAYVANQRATADDEIFFTDVSVSPPTTPASARTMWPANADVPTSASYQKFSPAGEHLIFRCDINTDGVQEVFLVDLTGISSGQAVTLNGPLVVPGGSLGEFAWSPDSRRVVYLADQDKDGDQELYVVDIATPGTSHKVNGTLQGTVGISSSADNWAFSPDGKKVAYLGDQNVDQFYELFVTDVSALPPPAISVQANGVMPGTATSHDVSNLYWLNPRFLLYAGDQFVAGMEELAAVDLSAFPAVSAPIRLLTAPQPDGDLGSGDVYPSPDGQRVLFIGDFDLDGSGELYLTDFSSGAPVTTKLNESFTSTSQTVASATWSPDGRFVAFVATGYISQGVNELFVVDVSGPQPGTPVRVSNPGATSANHVSTAIYSFSPDGRLIAFQNATTTTNVDLYLVDLTKLGPFAPPVASVRQGTGDDVSRHFFSPDSQKLAYVGDLQANDVVELFVVDVSTGAAGGTTKVNATLPASGDVFSGADEVYWTRDSTRLIYRGDVTTDGKDEAVMATLGSSGSVTRRTLNGTMGSTSDVKRLKVQD